MSDEKQEEVSFDMEEILKVIAAKELQARNTVAEACHEYMVNIHKQVENSEITEPLEVVDAVYTWIRDAFAASVHMAHIDGIVDDKDFREAFQLIYGYTDEQAEKAIAHIGSAYKEYAEKNNA